MVSVLLGLLVGSGILRQGVPEYAAPLSDSKLDGAVVSAYVSDLDGKVLFQKNTSTRVMPASNQKLLTSLFALAMRPNVEAAYSATRFWVEESTLVIDCPGSPLTTTKDLLTIRRSLNLEGVSEVRIRQGYNPGWCESWQLEDAPNRYAPPITALTVDRGGCEAYIDRGQVVFRSSTPEITFDIPVVMLPSSESSFSYDPHSGELKVLGRLPKDGPIDTLALANPVSEVLSALGVSRTRVTVADSLPTRKPDAVIQNVPIKVLLKECLPSSDNYLAESLLNLGCLDAGLTSPKFSTASKRLTNWLTQVVGIDPKDLRVADGSGLSRKNNVTTRAIGTLLQWAHKQPTWNLYRDTLAVSGKGTLANRLKSIHFVGKTGTLDMVVALSGVVQCSDGKERIVSVILNHFGCSSNEARVLVDRFVENISGATF